jgi:hypothetical protein
MTPPIRRSRRTAAVLTAALALLGTATGCGGTTDQLAEEAAERAAEAAGEDVELDVDGDSVTVESEEGSVTSTAGDELPADFPEDVPLVDGTVAFSQTLEVPDGTSWTVLLETTGSVPDITAAATQALEGAGFTIDSETTSETDEGTTTFVSAQRDDALVQVTVTTDGDVATASYTVVEVPAG